MLTTWRGSFFSQFRFAKEDVVISCLTLYRFHIHTFFNIYRVLEMSAVKLLFEDFVSND